MCIIRIKHMYQVVKIMKKIESAVQKQIHGFIKKNHESVPSAKQ